MPVLEQRPHQRTTPNGWRFEVVETHIDDPRLVVNRHVGRQPDGNDGAHWEVCIKHGSFILPIRPDANVVLVSDYRQASKTFSLEVPGGGQKVGETPLQTAERELLSEVGYVAREIVPIRRTWGLPSMLNSA